MAKDLSLKQIAFVAEYLVDLNATQAAIRAGYSRKSAEVTGSRLLVNAKVQLAIAEQMANRSERVNIEQDKVLLEIARLAFSDPRRVFDGSRLMRMDEIDDNTAAAISSIKCSTRQLGEGEVEHIAEIKFWPKTSALEMAGKHLGLFERDNEQRKPAMTQNVYAGLPDHVLGMIGRDGQG